MLGHKAGKLSLRIESAVPPLDLGPRLQDLRTFIRHCDTHVTMEAARPHLINLLNGRGPENLKYTKKRKLTDGQQG